MTLELIMASLNSVFILVIGFLLKQALHDRDTKLKELENQLDEIDAVVSNQDKQLSLLNQELNHQLKELNKIDAKIDELWEN